MKLNKKTILLPILLIIIISVLLLIWNPPFITQIFRNYKTANISAQEFIPVDTNKELTENKIRLIVVNEFYATQLDNNRNLHIYLPPSYYDDTSKAYPVLYVHDGKVVFDISDWSKESLNMHIHADELILDGKIEEIIIVGIDNIGDTRMSEYVHWDGLDQGTMITSTGLLHEDFVLNDVKPFIDKNFRTLSDKENTALMGMSIGGLSTINIGFRNPDVFSKLAMLSPYFSFGDNKLYQLISEGSYKEKQAFKLWIDVGSKEGSFIDMAAYTIVLLAQNGYEYGNDLMAYEAPDGEHSEKFWSERVKSILLYFYGNIGAPVSLELFTDGEVSLKDGIIEHINAVETYDSGFKKTDILGSYTVENPDILHVENYGGAMYPLSEGSTMVTYTSSSGLTESISITVVK